jgi:predicted metalloprotease with PDZ domain
MNHFTMTLQCYFNSRNQFLGWGRGRAESCFALSHLRGVHSHCADTLKWVFILSWVCIAGLPCTVRAESEPFAYTIGVEGSPVPKRVRITLTVPAQTGQRVRVQMPVWSPGDYSVQNHGQYVREMQAQQNGKPLAVSHPNVSTWEAMPLEKGTVRFSYTLETTPRGNFSENVYLDGKQIFLNGAGTFVYVDGGKETPCRLTINSPDGWNVFTSPCLILQEKNRFLAPDYDHLADSPIILARDGFWNVKSFVVEGKPHRIVFFGEADKARYADDYSEVCRRIVQAGSRIMGGLPYPGYDFDIDVNGSGGGLEHACCARLAIGGNTPPIRSAEFLAHEFFHAWNVKRVRPKVLGPFDSRKASRITTLRF